MVQAMNDPIPADALSLVEVYERFQMAKRGKFLKTTGFQIAHRLSSVRSKLIGRILEELKAAFSSRQIEAIVFDPDKNQECRFTPSEWSEADWPDRMFLTERIEYDHGGPLAKLKGRTPYVNRERYLTWLDIHIRYDFLGRIADGLMSPNIANERLTALGFEPLYVEPNPKDFHPEREVFWTLTMAVAWISWRSLIEVTRQWISYTRVQTH
jgi:hypothetical protein